MRRLFFLLRLLAQGAHSLALCCLRAVCAVCALLGVLAISDALQPPRLPSVRPMPAVISAIWSDSHPRPLRAELLVMDKAERWATMQEALRLLDIVCSPVSLWTRQKYASGHLVFETPDRGRYAYYMPGPGLLGINLIALHELSDAELAVTLAHEFRHSRQNMLRGVQCEIAGLFGMDRRFEFVEAEAYEFEGRVRRAIRGRQ